MDKVNEIGENTFLKLRQQRDQARAECDQAKIQRDVALRKLNKGFMKLNLNNSKLDYVSDEEIYTFENCLRSLVEEIMNPKIDFIDSAT